MAVLWILEKPGKQEQAIALKLQGDYAVRCFASIDSLKRLTRLSHAIKPEMIIVDCDDYPQLEQEVIQKTLQEQLPNAIKVYIANIAAAMEFSFARSQLSDLSFVVRSLLESHGHKPGSEEQRLGSTIFDFPGLCVKDSLSGESISLSFKEASILRLMMKNSSRCVSREELMAEVWPKIRVSPRTIDSHISRLRKRLEPVGLMIESRYGSGYVLRLGHEF